MSPRDSGRFTDAATLALLVEDAYHVPGGEGDASVRDDIAGEGARPTDPMPPRPISRARVGPSRNAHYRPYNDPSNYLG
jgi:hypothetical protein